MAKFWGKLFLINFAIGVVTGVTLEFQFGTNWSNYSIYVGDIFGSLLAVEATVAFFLESTFIAVWLFGWDRIGKVFHCVSIWIVALASNISAFWILAANGWMQHPVGYTIRNGRAELTDFLAVVTSKHTILKFIHTLSGAYSFAGCFIMGISAYHMLRKNDRGDFFKDSFKLASRFALIGLLVAGLSGHFTAELVAHSQPSKFAAMESLWETQKGAPMSLLAIPDEKNERNYMDFLKVPGALSFLAYMDFNAEVKGLKDIPKDERPPVLITFLAFRAMVGLATLLGALLAFGWWFNDRITQYPKIARLFIYAIPIPVLIIELGWVVAEVGRQPWIVYGMMKTSDAVSHAVSTGQVWFSFLALLFLYSFLGLANYYLIFKFARRGPDWNTIPAAEVK
jgi:cytochrome d ubiquinol oxidase subunit I